LSLSDHRFREDFMIARRQILGMAAAASLAGKAAWAQTA